MSKEIIDDGSIADSVLSAPPKMRRRILSRKDLTATELRKLASFFHAREPQVARRIRAVLLRALSGFHKDSERHSGYVAKKLEIERRVIFRWFAWFRARGIRGLLQSKAARYRQCSACQTLSGLDRFAKTKHRCRECQTKRERARRLMPTVKRKHRESCRKAKSRYRSSPKGRAARQREYERRITREARQS